jgi:subtilisin family serine protease
LSILVPFVFSVIIGFICTTACSSEKVKSETVSSACSSNTIESETVSSPNDLKEYDDVRTIVYGEEQKTEKAEKDISGMDLSKSGNIIPTLWFNKKTKWPDKSKMPPDVNPDNLLEKAMNPGLGVMGLHSRGIIGKGVNVAIIDQPMLDDHPEYKGKIVKYKNFSDTSQPSMHGPGVTSLLVGEKTGTAPGARVYYAATPTWNADAAYQAKALDWIIKENSKLAANEKIRVVSVSAAPSGPNSPFTQNNDKWDKAVELAKANGILVLDCSGNKGLFGPAFFSDLNDVDNIKKCMPGYPDKSYKATDRNLIMVPVSPRTTAEEYITSNCSYQYTGRGGLSWAIPYCSGVLAMGWQIRPELTANEIVDILFKTAYKNNGAKIINPVAFVNYIEKHKPHK